MVANGLYEAACKDEAGGEQTRVCGAPCGQLEGGVATSSHFLYFLTSMLSVELVMSAASIAFWSATGTVCL